MRAVAGANEPPQPIKHAAIDGDPFHWLRSEVDRLFDIVGKPDATMTSEVAPPLALDMIENDDTYRITAELPGMKDDDIEVTLANGVLTISGEKRHEEDRQIGGTLLSERRYGCFARDVRLPDDADPAHVEARIKKGVLTINLRKDEHAASRVRRVEVKKD
ncbi:MULTISPECIES: Hsp20/alpha crystallin family protein [unclassified Sphingomonas]|uniref:Hsp20/alpha crystallin family protein n=1 Tax=unclassified Sphingomonas TaxID=196159 RepID=UPI000B869E5F|nr:MULTISPECIES: Hsp20/alpha crystallin family protein [unclassified Sphingomonas]MCG7349931.1 Hsp20/alpha crystallin family protein [Sphingomonas sp. ACRSK]